MWQELFLLPSTGRIRLFQKRVVVVAAVVIAAIQNGIMQLEKLMASDKGVISVFVARNSHPI